MAPDEGRTDVQQGHHEDVADLARLGYQQRLNRSLGGFSSFAAGFSYISILTGMFQLFGFGYGFGGPMMFWSWLIVLAGQFCVALVFGELGARFPIAGSVYQWSKRVSSLAGAWMAGWMMLIGSIVSVAAVSVAMQIVMPQIWSGFQVFKDNAQNAVFLGSVCILITTFVNVLGVKAMSKINNVGVAAELIGVVLMIILLAVHAKRGPQVVLTTQGAGPGLPGWAALGLMAPLLLAAVMPSYVMYGFDTAGSLAEETKNPRRRTPIAILQALGAAGIAGALLLIFALMATNSLNLTTLGNGGLPYVLTSVLGSTLGKIFLVDVAFAIFVCTLAIQTASVRLAFSMARDNNLPFGDKLAHVTSTRHSPATPSVVTGILAILILVLNVGNPKIFLVVTSVAIVIVYIAYLLVTLPTMLRRQRGWPEDQGKTGLFTLGRTRGRIINGVAVAYGAIMTLNLVWPRSLIYGNGIYAWGGIITVAVFLLVGLAYYYGVQRHKSEGITHEHRVVTSVGDVDS